MKKNEILKINGWNSRCECIQLARWIKFRTTLEWNETTIQQPYNTKVRKKKWKHFFRPWFLSNAPSKLHFIEFLSMKHRFQAKQTPCCSLQIFCCFCCYCFWLTLYERNFVCVTKTCISLSVSLKRLLVRTIQQHPPTSD